MLVDDLKTQGWSLDPAFLNHSEGSVIRGLIDSLRSQGVLSKAGIGQGARRTVASNIRGDFTCWLEVNDAHAEVKPVFEKLEKLRTELNQTGFLGLRSFEAHLTFYPEKTRYEKHVDRFKESDARVISFVLYLNENWQPADGGLLQLESEVGTVEIEPKGGSLILFLSELPHEVLLTEKPRYSLTGWFRRD